MLAQKQERTCFEVSVDILCDLLHNDEVDPRIGIYIPLIRGVRIRHDSVVRVVDRGAAVVHHLLRDVAVGILERDDVLLADAVGVAEIRRLKVYISVAELTGDGLFEYVCTVDVVGARLGLVDLCSADLDPLAEGVNAVVVAVEVDLHGFRSDDVVDALEVLRSGEHYEVSYERIVEICGDDGVFLVCGYIEQGRFLIEIDRIRLLILAPRELASALDLTGADVAAACVFLCSEVETDIAVDPFGLGDVVKAAVNVQIKSRELVRGGEYAYVLQRREFDGFPARRRVFEGDAVRPLRDGERAGVARKDGRIVAVIRPSALELYGKSQNARLRESEITVFIQYAFHIEIVELTLADGRAVAEDRLDIINILRTGGNTRNTCARKQANNKRE